MSLSTRIAAASLILASSALSASAHEPARSRGARPAEIARSVDPNVQPAAAPGFATDPYGFAPLLNAYRASVGLPPVSYDPGLSSWASRNNVRQCLRGLGHYVNPGCLQNCGWNYSSASDVVQGWMNSAGHRENLLSPSISRFGIAFGPGPYWTWNAR